MRVKSLHISLAEYDSLRTPETKEHRDGCWWAVFSVDPQERVWPFVCYGCTPEEDRHYIELDKHPTLADAARNLLSNVDERGGRFFISSEGAFFKEEESDTPGSVPQQFVKWKADQVLPDRRVKSVPAKATQGTPITKAELEMLIRGR